MTLCVPHPALSPAFLQAFVRHCYFLARAQGRDVPFELALEDFNRRFAADWRRAKMREDCRAELSEIDRHKFFRSIEEARDIGRARAAAEWCERHAADWRRDRESLERNGFLRRAVAVPRAGVDPAPLMAALVDIARRYEADLFLHRPGMRLRQFELDGKPFLRLRAMTGALALVLHRGDALEFIATGQAAGGALDAVEQRVKGAAGPNV